MAAPRSVARADNAACTCPLYVGGDPACYYHGLRDRHLPDLLAPDPLPWAWPFPCHRFGHVWIVGKMFCDECGASYRAHGPDQGEWRRRSYRVGEGRRYEWEETATALTGSRSAAGDLARLTEEVRIESRITRRDDGGFKLPDG